MNRLDEIVVDQVLENETTCREMLRRLVARGVGLPVPESSLTHDECIRVIRAILDELGARENLQ